ncbi:glycosyltransferase family 2 protein [Formosa sp. S-31]|uniref:glycosyltransferase family 2 protein n=1 Tax=Formosa sp. S-31 TaxID=2790949 RepID=UPI003EBFADFC
MITLSVVIPVLDGMATLPKLFYGLKQQTIYNQIEVIIIDSGSTDGTLEYVKENGVILIEISKTDFNHGATRNLGVQRAQGEFVLLTVQDAWTEDPKLLETMLSHFKDSNVAGVCGQQIVPHDTDKNPHEWFRPFSKPKPRFVHFKAHKEFEQLTPKEQRQACIWDDVIAMYRKSVLLDIPFKHVVFGEDMLWAKDVLLQGYTIVYDTTARVNHYHYQFPEYTYKRVLIAHAFIYHNFKLLKNKTYGLKDYLLIIYRNFKWKCHPKWIRHNFNILTNKNKATRKLISAVESNAIEDLLKELAINVPIGQQKDKQSV